MWDEESTTEDLGNNALLKWGLTAAFVLVSYPYLARAETSPQACAKMDDGGERLICYDGIFRETRSAQAPTPETNTKWQLSTKKSQIDDSATLAISLDSDDDFPGKLGGREKATFILRCDEHATSVYFVIGEYFLAEIQNYGQITYRVDEKKASKKNFNVSTDNKALGLWSGGSAIPFIKQVLGGNKLVIRVTPYNESPLTASFDISGVDEAIKPVREECGW